MSAYMRVRGMPFDPPGHPYKQGDCVITPDGRCWHLGEAVEPPTMIGIHPPGHGQAITDEDARRVGLELDAEGYVKPGQVIKREDHDDRDEMAVNAYAEGLERNLRRYEAALEPDTTERADATSITINLAPGMATDVALMHVISRAAVMLGAGPRDWDAMAAWLRERELPK